MTETCSLILIFIVCFIFGWVATKLILSRKR
jgi:hypothetical protein